MLFSRLQARSSGGERYLDAVEVGGSKPPAPTIRIECGDNYLLYEVNLLLKNE